MILNAFGSTERKGRPWDARYASPVITLFGNTELDFREAQLPEGETEMVILAGFGGVEVTVPDDLPVLVTGLSVLGSRDVLGQVDSGIAHGTDHATPDFATATGKRLRLSIFSALGSVEVRRLPVATATPPMEV
ncbi:MAG: cell wall-active antibiotics response protein [Chloroflexota bacterium]